MNSGEVAPVPLSTNSNFPQSVVGLTTDHSNLRKPFLLECSTINSLGQTVQFTFDDTMKIRRMKKD
jgi:hypothetical protein